MLGFVNGTAHAITVPGAYGYLEPDSKVAWLDEFFPDGQRTRDDLPDELHKLALKIMDEGGDAGHLETQGATSSLFACLAASPMGGWMLRLEIRPHHMRPRFRDLLGFSPRVNEVLCWMVEGKRNGEIAVILGISARTVEKHVAVTLTALGVENRATAIVRAMERHANSSARD